MSQINLKNAFDSLSKRIANDENKRKLEQCHEILEK